MKYGHCETYTHEKTESKYQGAENHLKILVTRLQVSINQDMVKEPGRVSLFNLRLSISESLLDLFFCLSPPVVLNFMSIRGYGR